MNLVVTTTATEGIHEVDGGFNKCVVCGINLKDKISNTKIKLRYMDLSDVDA
jgi:hypothetical protein